MDTISANNLKQARHALGMTQNELGAALGWSNGRQVSNIESGIRPLNIQTGLAVECLLRREKKFNLFVESACND